MPFYDQTTYYTVDPLDHVMDDIEPGAASPRDMDMQEPHVPDTPSVKALHLNVMTCTS
jgi:hypothetical protein